MLAWKETSAAGRIDIVFLAWGNGRRTHRLREVLIRKMDRRNRHRKLGRTKEKRTVNREEFDDEKSEMENPGAEQIDINKFGTEKPSPRVS